MPDPKHERLRALFDRALELPAKARPAFLASKCANDAELKQRLQGMLAAADDEHFLSRPTGHEPAPVPTPEASLREGPGTRIGPYKLLQQIGEGGFGVVFMAEQEKPVARKVALKVIKLGMDTRQVVARFEQERQALAMMDHPNIARVLDAGATVTGRPYFVMDLVKGDPIVEYCDKNNLTIDERLELFAQVCHAVQHAHGKGVIHRDIKPSNILVGTQDGRPMAKVIDFGIAKATSQKLTDKTLFTEHQQVIGTLQYMSPEQADGSLDIDTRTDVYSLGVLLYELLIGSTPFDQKTLKNAVYGELQRMIREVDPPKPSTRLSESQDMLASIAAHRRTAPTRLGTILRGDLDWIVMKALEKDRQRRYETANGLAQDVRRYLGGEAVTAAPPSASYRLRKFVRRNRGMVGAVAAVGVALLLGAVAATWLAIEAHRHSLVARQERTTAVEQTRIADEQRAAAVAQKKEAEKQQGIAEASAMAEARARANAEAVLRFVLETLNSSDPMQGGGPFMLVREAMTRMAQLLDTGVFKAQPEVELRVRATIARILQHHGEAHRAIAQYEMVRDAQIATLGGEHQDTLDTLQALASAYGNAGRRDAAIALLVQVSAARTKQLGADHPATLHAQHDLADMYRLTGRLDEAIALFMPVRDARSKKLGVDDQATLATVRSLGLACLAAGRGNEAIALFEQLVASQVKVYGVDHPMTLFAQQELARAYGAGGKRAEAIVLFEANLKIATTRLGRTHPTVQRTMADLGICYRDSGQPTKAIPLLEEVWRTIWSVSRDELERPRVEAALFDAYAKVGNAGAAAKLVMEPLVTARRSVPADSPELADALAPVALALIRLGAFTDAESLLRECLAIREKTQPDSWRTGNARSLLGGALLGQAKSAEAEPLLLAGYADMKQREQTIPANAKVRLGEAADRLIQLYTAMNKPDEVAKWKLERAK